MGGKLCTRWRKEAMFGRDYTYSRSKLPKEEGPMPALVAKAIDHMNKRFGEASYNACLVNYYEAHDYISEHQDDEKQHVKGMPIATFSFGETRKLTIKRHRAKMKRSDGSKNPLYFRTGVDMPHGSLTLMLGSDFQRLFTHQVGKGKRPRLSLTVRAF